MRIRLALLLLLASCRPAAEAPPRDVTVDLAAPAASSASARDEASAPSAAPLRASAGPGADVVDVSQLSARERDAFEEELTELLSPCVETPVSLGRCLEEHRPCAACAPAARFLARQVRSGKAKADRETAFHARFDAGKVKTVPLDDSPSKGPADAAETIVVWADFECPMCGTFEPMLEELQRRAGSRARVVFKHYPISHHAHAQAAARAAIAAGQQGKFWEMAKKLFANQGALEDADLKKYAKELGLDARRFDADRASRRATEIVDRDVSEADELGLQGTPFVFMNGRELDLGSLGSDAVADMMDWVEADLELAGADAKTAPRPE